MAKEPTKLLRSTSSGKLLGLLSGLLYAVFTLLPNSHSLMITWPWVFIAQAATLLPIFWFLLLVWQEKKLPLLGNFFDWLVLLVLIGLIISTLFAQFTNQAFWYAIKPLGLIAAVYALNFTFKNPTTRFQVFVAQGYLNLAFIVTSLYGWATQTYLPEKDRLQVLEKNYQIPLTYDFNQLELRNWAPLGHQNYVAGYLLLCLPLITTLAVRQKGWQRWLWIAGIILGILTLYTTNSRAGWLGLIVFAAFSFGLLLMRTDLAKPWLSIACAALGVICIGAIATNSRLQSLFNQLLNGEVEGEIGYRLINNILGWRAGIAHPFTGIGLGGVPLLYQKYLPFWGSRESELNFQLHSTPAQLWAEMGLWGIILPLGAFVLLALILGQKISQITADEQLFALAIFGAISAYGFMSLTDFQLDNISISGTLVIYFAGFASIFGGEQSFSKQIKTLTFAGLALLGAIIVWLIPIQRAWQLSSSGFAALGEKNLQGFVEYLTVAQQLAPFEPYYPYQLGWVLGNSALTAPKNQQQDLFKGAIATFEKAVTLSPYWEFGYSNLGWLLLNFNPRESTKNFKEAATLVPAKKSMFYALGLSLLAQNKVDQAVEAFTLECLRDPLFITNPGWNSPLLKPISVQVFQRLEAQYRLFIQQQPNNSFWHQCLGGLLWWQNDLIGATKELQNFGAPVSKVILKLSLALPIEPEYSQLPESGAKMAIAAWLQPTEKEPLLSRAWVKETKTEIEDNIKQQLLGGMATAKNFGEWLRDKPAIWQFRREREGFGVVSRHLDGVSPQDFYLVQENVAIVTWFEDLFPSPVTKRDLDIALQPLREKLLSSLN